MDHNNPNALRRVDEQRPWYRTINVEPTIFFYSVAFGLLIPITSLFLFYARCVEIFAERSPDGHYSDIKNATKFCMRISQTNDSAAMNRVQADVATMRIYMQAANTIAVIVMAPIFGAWADKKGRRTPLLFLLVGSVLYTSTQTMGVFFYDRLNVFFFFVSAEIASGLFGGITSLFAMSSAIVTDDARADKSLLPSSLPLRVAISCGCQQLGILLGTTISDVIESLEFRTAEEKIAGYLMVYCIATSCMLLATAYSFLFLRDQYRTVLEMNAETALVLGLSSSDRPQAKGFFGSIADCIAGVWEVASAKRQGWQRFCLNLCVISVFVEFITFEVQISCLFVKRPPFEWTDAQFTNYMLFRFVASTLGMLAIPLAVRQTNWVGKESWMILFGISAGAMANGVFAFARNTQQLLTTVPLAFGSGAVSPGYRTLLPKLCKQEETARVFSMMSLVIVISPLCSAILLNNLYKHTMDTWPGFVFFIECLLLVCALFGQTLVHFLLRPFWQQNSAFEEADALISNSYEDEEEEEEERVSDPFDAPDGDSVRAMNSEEGDILESNDHPPAVANIN